MQQVVHLLNLIRCDFCIHKIRDVDGCLEYKSPLFQFPVSQQFEDWINEKFKGSANGMEYSESDYQISVRTTPTLLVEEKVTKTLVVYSNGTVWLHLIKDVEEVNRILQFISLKAGIADERDLKRLCGEGGLSRWSYIKKTNAISLKEFGSKMGKLIDSRHYTSAKTRCMRESFSVKYEERRSLELHVEPNGISVDVTVKDLFSKETDLMKTIEDFLSGSLD